MNLNSPLEQLIGSSLDALRRARTEGEREKVEAAVGGFRSGGLGVIGPEDTLHALITGQVDELLIASTLRSLQPVGAHAPSTAADSLEAVLAEPVLEPITAGEPADADAEMVRLADELVTRATQTSAKITFVENAALLADYGGVAAILRFKI
jgi:peptide subunit release factor 1 (eRF1)